MNVFRTHSIVSLILAAATQSAIAGYTVMDDDLFPTRAIPASVAAAQTHRPSAIQPNAGYRPAYDAPSDSGETYSILFRKGIWGLDEEGNNAISDLLPMMQDNKVIITGRPDATPNKHLADQRANSLRVWLIRHGIPAAQIETRSKPTINSAVGKHFPVEIQIVPSYPTSAAAPVLTQASAPRSQVQTSSNGIRTTISPMPAAATTSVAIIATPNSDARLDLIRQITLSAQANRIDAKSAITMIAELLANPQPGQAPRMPTATAAPVPGAEFGLAASPETIRPKEWILSADKTLKDNIGEWAKKDGYDIDWKAANYFKVGRTLPVTGELFDAIDRVTTAAGVKMEVWKKDRLIRISDRTQ